MVLILEAMLWIEEPLSTRLLELILDDPDTYYLSRLAHYVKTLKKAEVIEVVKTRQVRGAQESFYYFTGGGTWL